MGEIKRFIKVCARNVGIIIIFIEIILIFTYIFNLSEVSQLTSISTIFIFLAISLLFIPIMAFLVLIKLIHMVIKSTITNIRYGVSTEAYEREIFADYGPALASYIANRDYDNTNEYIATILNMIYDRKIKAVENGDKVEYFESTNKKLNNHEAYMYDVLINKKKICRKDFTDSLINDCFEYFLVDEEKYDKYIKIVNGIKKEERLFWNFVCIILFLIGLFSFGFFSINAILGILPLLLIPIALVAYTNFTNIIKTKKGRIHTKRWKNFARYIKHFSMIKNKNIEDIAIYDKYIIYAIALGQAKNIENSNLEKKLYDEVKNSLV